MTDSETCSNRSAKQFTRMTEERINSIAKEVYDYLKRDRCQKLGLEDSHSILQHRRGIL